MTPRRHDSDAPATDQAGRSAGEPPRNPARSWLAAGGVFLVAFLIYFITAQLVGRSQPPRMVYYDELAAALLRGQLHLEAPSDIYDLTPHEGRWYVPFLPLPAIMMMPWVALFGLDHTNPVYFSLLFGALTIAFAWLMLEGLAQRGWAGLRPRDRLWLCGMLALGSAYWYTAVESSVWYLAHTFTCTFVALAAWLAVRCRSAWPASIALALALWGRPNVILTWPLLLAMAIEQARDARGALDHTRVVRWVIGSLAPLTLSVLGLLTYNYARFDDPFDFGYQRQNVSARLIYDLHGKGQFSYEYIQRNLYHMLIGPPLWPAGERWPEPDPQGMSIFITTPALLWLVRARRPRPLVKGAWLALALLLLPIVTYYNTGWRQFGYRFSLDFIIPALVLLASAATPRMCWRLKAAILLGVAVNAYGVWWWFIGHVPR
ncbi:MAG: hypothetical protein LC135_00105 [Phycisphaerae bacterium]|nr:hypothetical protein [Phycisphaerae bacterium]MCZ2398254.1 hypothetical protein [Phycisphaerae bacterium]NUQ50483.1 hypothetical protein [Phycisphaerae bacterium]